MPVHSRVRFTEKNIVCPKHQLCIERRFIQAMRRLSQKIQSLVTKDIDCLPK